MVQESFTMADDKVSIFSDSTLPVNAFKQLEEIRRHGKLCDITLRVRYSPRDNLFNITNKRSSANAHLILFLGR